MARIKTKLKDRTQIAEGTVAFYLEKPKDFEAKAGQSLDLTLINPTETDAEGNTRAFSIASAPHEPYLMVATRMRDTAFKRVLKNLELGAELEIDGPFGSFILHGDVARPAVFLMGGIGITPARSIILDAAKKNLSHTMFLFYSNRRPEDAPFLDDLMQVEKESPNYKFIGTMTNMEESVRSWGGETGYINEAMLQKYITDLSTPIYYLAGPSAMVAAMRKMLHGIGMNDDSIRTEEFSGY